VAGSFSLRDQLRSRCCGLHTAPSRPMRPQANKNNAMFDPFCALKMGPVSCLCVRMPSDGQSFWHQKMFDEDEFVEPPSNAEDENGNRYPQAEFYGTTSWATGSQPVKARRRTDDPFQRDEELEVTVKTLRRRRPSASAQMLARQMSSQLDLTAGGKPLLSRCGSTPLGVGSVGSRSMAEFHRTGSLNLETPIKEMSSRYNDEGYSAGCSTAAELFSEERVRSQEPGFVEVEESEHSDGSNEGQDPNEVEEVKAFNQHVTAGRFLQAHRELDRLRSAGLDPSSFLSDAYIERTLRITTMYERSLVLFRGRVEELSTNETNTALGLKWGFEIRDGKLKTVMVCHYHDLDIVRCFAAVQERDLQKPFNSGLEKAEVLNEQEYEYDNLWRSWTFSKTLKTKNDSVAIISSMDCLDQGPTGSLWSAMYSPTEEAAEALGTAIPEVEEGRIRPEYACMVYSLTPLVRCGAGDRSIGLVMKIYTDVQLPAAASGVLALTPNYLLKKLFRPKFEDSQKKFREFVMTSKELDRRIATGPRRDFYARMRERLAGGSDD